MSAEIEAELAEDLRIFGNCFWKIVNGQKVRVHPRDVQINADGTLVGVDGRLARIAERRTRHTIMDGEVVMFATDFESRPGVLGDVHEPQGPFEISASRNQVVVHRAGLSSDTAVELFVTAIRQAQREAHRLTSADRGGNYRTHQETL
jgi:hypothetical protein